MIDVKIVIYCLNFGSVGICNLHRHIKLNLFKLNNSYNLCNVSEGEWIDLVGNMQICNMLLSGQRNLKFNDFNVFVYRMSIERIVNYTACRDTK